MDCRFLGPPHTKQNRQRPGSDVRGDKIELLTFHCHHPDVQPPFCVRTAYELSAMPGATIRSCEGCQLFTERTHPGDQAPRPIMAFGRMTSPNGEIVGDEPVGDFMKTVIDEIGLSMPFCDKCQQILTQMNAWGIDGCNANRALLVQHFNEMASQSTWWDWIKVAAHGYATSSMLIDEAIRRTRTKLSKSTAG